MLNLNSSKTKGPYVTFLPLLGGIVKPITCTFLLFMLSSCLALPIDSTSRTPASSEGKGGGGSVEELKLYISGDFAGTPAR